MAAPITTNLSLPLGTLGDVRFKSSYRAAMALLDTAVAAAAGEAGTVLNGSKTHDFADLANAGRESTTVTVTGAALGDFVIGVSVSVDAADLLLWGYVSAANTVTVVAQNNTGGAVNLASATLAVRVRAAA